MTIYRAVFILCCITLTLVILGFTSEKLSARLAWAGAALLAVTVGFWVRL